MDGWLRDREVQRGAILTIGQVWMLSQLWYGDRLAPDFRRPTMDEAHVTFERAGLTGPFWRLDSRKIDSREDR